MDPTQNNQGQSGTQARDHLPDLRLSRDSSFRGGRFPHLLGARSVLRERSARSARLLEAAPLRRGQDPGPLRQPLIAQECAAMGGGAVQETWRGEVPHRGPEVRQLGGHLPKVEL